MKATEGVAFAEDDEKSSYRPDEDLPIGWR